MNDITARIGYSKKYPANMLGHLDTVAALQRGMRRAAWPVVMTGGYSPRVKISAGPPLTLGFSSEAEYLEVALARELSPAQEDRFKESVIKGIEIRTIEIFRKKGFSINDDIAGFVYIVEFGGNPPDPPVRAAENIVEKGNGYIKINIYREDGGFKNPLKYLGIDKNECIVRKTDCIWNNSQFNTERR
ncbi:MAG: DUF2344 domain-containing protein [Elusimicrobia bacterium]|nr:DUF2344 domain-containing protein [Elusimicrobiota bacterium]